MSYHAVQTIKDLIYYQNAKIAARIVYDIPDGTELKQIHYGLIKSIFQKYAHRNMSWTEILSEEPQFEETTGKCVYCGKSGDNLHWEHIAPTSFKIKAECEHCDILHSINNQVCVCSFCSESKGKLGLYEFYQKLFPLNKHFYDY